MVDYYLGYFWGEKGDPARQLEFFQKAAKSNPRYVFPFRLESIAVLKRASQVNPADGRAPYYLGNLLFDEQPAAALKEWERSREIDPGFATVHRNLAIAYQQVEHDLGKAVTSMEKAVQCDPSDARLLYELDVLHERAGTAHDKRLAILEKNRATIEKRDDAMSRLVLLHVQAGRYDDAARLLSERHFNVWEGSRGLRDAYEDTYLLQGLSRFRRRDYRAALEAYQKALEFPLNLENAWPYRGGRMPEIFFFIATAHEALGDGPSAMQFYRKGGRGEAAGEMVRLALLRGHGAEETGAGRAVRRAPGRAESVRFGRTRLGGRLLLEVRRTGAAERAPGPSPLPARTGSQGTGGSGRRESRVRTGAVAGRQPALGTSATRGLSVNAIRAAASSPGRGGAIAAAG